MPARADIIESFEVDDDTVIVLRYNPEMTNPYFTHVYHIESDMFDSGRWFISPDLAEEDYWNRVSEAYDQ